MRSKAGTIAIALFQGDKREKRARARAFSPRAVAKPVRGGATMRARRQRWPWNDACSRSRAMRILAVAFTGSLVVASTAAMLACGSRRLPAPSYVGQPQDALVQVPYPPPPA